MDLFELLRGLESVLALFAGAGGEADVGWDDIQLPLELRSSPRSYLALLC